MAKKRPTANKARGAGESFLAACSGDVDAIRDLVGDVRLRTLAEVARAFGVSPETVKTVWRPAKMPGQAGDYSLAEILAWKIARARRVEGHEPPAAAGGSGGPNALDKKREADARKATAQATKEERANALEEGNLLFRDDVERIIRELVIAARENFRRIPRQLMPRFPASQAAELSDEIAKRIDATLKQMSEWTLP